MKIVFMGTPDFSVPCLKALIDSGHEVPAVFTQPDKPKGRKYVLTPPPVKVCAEENSIQVFQLQTLKDGKAFELLADLNPDAIIVVAYGKILPKNIIELPKFGCINVHASLLPQYRGSAPIQWAVIDGQKQSGVTIMQMDEGIDTGDMLVTEKTEIGSDETSGELYDRLSQIGAKTLVNALEMIKNGEIAPQKQDDSLSTYAKMLDKSLCRIDFSKTAQEIHNLVRGLSPWPTALTSLDGKTLKVHKTELLNDKGTVDMIVKQCGDGKYIRLKTVQLEGKNKMDDTELLRGYKDSGNID